MACPARTVRDPIPHLCCVILLKQVPEELRPGGVMRTSALLRSGVTSERLRRALRDGELTRLRHGWLAVSWAKPEVVQAVRQGGVLGCASALAFRGAWKINDGRLHLYRSRHERRGVPECRAPKSRIASDLAVLRMPEALMQAVFCLPAYDFLAIAESTIHRRLLTEAELRTILSDLGPRPKRVMDLLDLAESGTETYVRLRLRARGVRLRPQVEIPGVGRVDFLIGTSLVVEVDSRGHHTDPAAYERDRVRDQKLHSLGYRVIRLTYEQVVFGWTTVEARLLAVIRAGLHLRRLVPQP